MPPTSDEQQRPSDAEPKTHYAEIFEAVKGGRIDNVMSLIDADASLLNVADSNQSTPLTRAFAYEHLDLAHALIVRGANLFAMNHSDKWGMRYIVEKDGITATHGERLINAAVVARPDDAEIFHAVWKRNHEGAAAIVKRDAEQASIRLAAPDGAIGFYNGLPYCGLTPLHYAVIAGDLAMVRVLLEAGAEVDAVPHGHKPDSRQTPMYLVPEGSSDIAQLLIDFGADPNHSTLYLSEGSSAMQKIVIDNGAGGTPLLRALTLKEFDKAAEIIRNDPSTINDRLGNSSIDTPLHMAVHAGNMEIVNLLLDHGMDVDTPSSRGYSALAMTSGMYCSFDMVKLLVERGADVRVANDSPVFATIWQHAYGHWDYEDVIRYLVKQGSKPRGLIHCVRGGNLPLTKILLELGADASETDEGGFYSNTGPSTGHTALDYCTGIIGDHQHPEIADLLRQHGGQHATKTRGDS